MKTTDQDLAEHGTNNGKHRQEDVASRDYAKQRAADVKDTEAKASKPKKPGK